MIYLVDTDVIIDFFKDQKPAVSLFHKISNEVIKISVITFLEIEYGIEKSYQPEKKKQQFRDFINVFSIEIVHVNTSIAKEFVKLKINLEKQKQPLADFDLFIAATAITHNFSLLTRNIKNFERVEDLTLFSAVS